MTIYEQNIINFINDMILNRDQVQIYPASTRILENAERTGWIEWTFYPVSGDALSIELHSDRIEVWTLDYKDNVIVDYDELSESTIALVQKMFSMLTADEKRRIGFDTIEL